MQVTAGARLDLIQSLVWNNTAANRGGGLYATSPDTEVNIINSTFAENTGNASTAIVVYRTPDFFNIFRSSDWCQAGGGVFATDARIVAINSVFARNSAKGVVNEGDPYSGGPFPQEVQCADGRQIYSERSPYGRRLGFASTSCLQDLNFYIGSGNVNSGDTDTESPTFSNAASGDLRLQPGSSCVDAGNNFVDFNTYRLGFQFAPERDIDGRDRIVDGDGDGNATIDMGAHESPAP